MEQKVVTEHSNVWTDRFIKWSRYLTGYPRPVVKSRVIEFENEEQFTDVLHEGIPTVVVLHLPGRYTSTLFKSTLAEVSAQYSRVNFVLVNCAKNGGNFCLQRQPKDFPTIELFQLRGAVGERFQVDILPYEKFEQSAYGLKQFLKQKRGIRPDLDSEGHPLPSWTYRSHA